MDDGRLLVPIPEGIHALGVGRSTFYRLIRSGELQQVRIGRRSFVTEQSLRNYVDRIVQAS
jgi:excisionase family DNA binding protein